MDWTEKDQRRFDRIANFIRKAFEKLPEDKRYMEPGRSMMIKHGMIEGEYKEPKLAAPYGHSEETAEGSDAKTEKKDGPSDEARSAGCPI